MACMHIARGLRVALCFIAIIEPRRVLSSVEYENDKFWNICLSISILRHTTSPVVVVVGGSMWCFRSPIRVLVQARAVYRDMSNCHTHPSKATRAVLKLRISSRFPTTFVAIGAFIGACQTAVCTYHGDTRS